MFQKFNPPEPNGIICKDSIWLDVGNFAYTVLSVIENQQRELNELRARVAQLEGKDAAYGPTNISASGRVMYSPSLSQQQQIENLDQTIKASDVTIHDEE